MLTHHAQDLCKAAGIPTGAYEVFTEPGPAKAYIRSQGAPIVVKADGLAAGKGVVVAQSTAEAEAAVDDMLVGRKFGEAGDPFWALGFGPPGIWASGLLGSGLLGSGLCNLGFLQLHAAWVCCSYSSV